MNKGREALAYLSYVVEHYAALPETVLFLHAHRDGAERAWHVDNAGHDNVEAVRALRLGYVAREGYVNLRCGVGTYLCSALRLGLWLLLARWGFGALEKHLESWLYP